MMNKHPLGPQSCFLGMLLIVCSTIATTTEAHHGYNHHNGQHIHPAYATDYEVAAGPVHSDAHLDAHLGLELDHGASHGHGASHTKCHGDKCLQAAPTIINHIQVGEQKVGNTGEHKKKIHFDDLDSTVKSALLGHHLGGHHSSGNHHHDAGLHGHLSAHGSFGTHSDDHLDDDHYDHLKHNYQHHLGHGFEAQAGLHGGSHVAASGPHGFVHGAGHLDAGLSAGLHHGGYPSASYGAHDGGGGYGGSHGGVYGAYGSNVAHHGSHGVGVGYEAHDSHGQYYGGKYQPQYHVQNTQNSYHQDGGFNYGPSHHQNGHHGYHEPHHGYQRPSLKKELLKQVVNVGAHALKDQLQKRKHSGEHNTYQRTVGREHSGSAGHNHSHGNGHGHGHGHSSLGHKASSIKPSLSRLASKAAPIILEQIAKTIH